MIYVHDLKNWIKKRERERKRTKRGNGFGEQMPEYDNSREEHKEDKVKSYLLGALGKRDPKP